MPPLHSLLLRQLKRLGQENAGPPSPDQWPGFLDLVSRAYAEADQDRYLLERSQDISSREMQELYERVRKINTELEQRVRERTQQLEEAYRELEAFSFSVSHDLRAPLRAINGFSGLLLEAGAQCTDAEAREYLERIHRATMRMGDIIDDLLALSRATRDELTTEATDLSAMAARIAQELAAASPREVEAAVEAGIVVDADPKLLRIVLENLLGNAWKFSCKRERARIAVGSQACDGERVIFVRDNGAGFDMSRAAKLFSPFARLHHADDFEGTGIGLATVRRIVERHGGRVWAEAAPDQGATFYFTLRGTPGEPCPGPAGTEPIIGLAARPGTD